MSVRNSILFRPSYVAHLLNGTFLFLLGIWILMPWPAFEGRPAWRVAAQVGPENLWAALLIIAGAIKIWSAYKEDYRREATGSFIAFIAWFLISVSWWISDWQSPVCVVGAYLTIQAAHHYLAAR